MFCFGFFFMIKSIISPADCQAVNMSAFMNSKVVQKIPSSSLTALTASSV